MYIELVINPCHVTFNCSQVTHTVLVRVSCNLVQENAQIPCTAENETISKTVKNSKLVEPLLRNRDQNITQNEHVYAICGWQEVAGGVTSGRFAKTVVICTNRKHTHDFPVPLNT